MGSEPEFSGNDMVRKRDEPAIETFFTGSPEVDEQKAEVKQEVSEEDGVEVIDFGESEEAEESLILPQGVPPPGLGGWTGTLEIAPSMSFSGCYIS